VKKNRMKEPEEKEEEKEEVKKNRMKEQEEKRS
jgi:hypothetical protein